MYDARLNRTLAILAYLASAIVFCMVAGVLATGFSQEFFQLAPSPAAVAAQLSDQPAHSLGLRLNLGLDNLFITVYCAFFAFWRCGCASCSVRWRSGSHWGQCC